MADKTLKYKGVPKGILIVDDEDLDILSKSWHFDFSNRHRGSEYFRIKRAATKVEKDSGSTKFIKIHKEVWEKHNGPIPEGYEVDHQDHNTLNNKKENLVLLTHVENSKRIRRNSFVPVFVET
jgi:hypothetical protein